MPVVLLLLSQLLDALTSVWGASLGLYESNALVHHDVFVLIVAKLVVCVTIIYIWKSTVNYPKAREIASIPFYAVAGATFYVAGLNLLTILHQLH